MSKSPVKASDLVQDIRKGLNDEELMTKYELSSTQLASVLTKLIDAKRITQEELDSRCMIGKPDPLKPINSVTVYESIIHERKIFISGIVFIFLVVILMALTESPMSHIRVITIICPLYLVIRLSRFLKQPIWLTVLYCLSMIIQFGYVVVFVALIIQSTKALRKAEESTSPTIIEAKRITQAEREALKFERKVFILGVVFIFLLVLILQCLPDVIKSHLWFNYIEAVSSFSLLYPVARLSRFLKQPIWLTVLYGLCALTFFAGPVAIVALIIQSTKALRKAEESTSPQNPSLPTGNHQNKASGEEPPSAIG